MDALAELRTILTEAIGREVPRPVSTSARIKIMELAKEVDVVMEAVKEASRMIGSKLKRGANNQVHETALGDLERNTRNIVHDVGNIIHTYLVLTQCKSQLSSSLSGRMRIFTGSPKPKKLNGFRKMVESMREDKLKSFLEDTRKTINQYSVVNTRTAQGTGDATKKAQKDTVIGLDEVTDTIVRYLLEEYSRLDIIRITGMPGVGKTTLASKVFNDPSIKLEFQTLIWIDVTPQFNRKDMMIAAVWEKLFQQDRPNDQLPETLVETVRMFLAKEKFLIVFDNVLYPETWKEIQSVLPMFNKKGKVLVTSSAVYSQVSSRPIIRLKCMDERTGWELLHSHVYGEVLADNSGPELEMFGKNIVNECGGLPRAIVQIARILADKISLAGRDNADPLEIWKHVASDAKVYLFSPNSAEELMVDSISKCYNILHPGLRDCFLYLGMFPGDTEIPVWKLIQLWNAEGLIKPVQNLRSEQIASSYLLELVERNLVTVKRWGLQYDPRTIVIHNMVREFCKNEAAGPKKNIFHEIKETKNGDFEPTSQQMERSRRLCIHSSSVSDFFLQNPKLQDVSSFLCYTNDPISIEKSHVQSITDAFSMLRVLEANSIKFPGFPDKLTRLLHLRYLALSGDKIKVIPRTTSMFLNIKTIIVNTMSPTLKVKANIWEMTHLRLFKTKAAIILSTEWKGKGGKNLQTLGNLSPKSCTDQVAYKAKNLKALGIRGELTKLLSSDFLEKLDNLDKLRLVNDAHPESKKKPLPKLPASNSFPPHLKFLVLSGTFLSWDNMSTLGNLHELMVLKLKNKAFMGDCWSTASGGFRKLVSLSIMDTNLRSWTASSNCFPKMGLIVLKYCKNLEGVPQQVLMGDKLGKMVMISVSRAVISCAKEMENARRKRNKGGRDLRLLIDEEDENKKYGRIFSVEYSSSAQHQLGF